MCCEAPLRLCVLMIIYAAHVTALVWEFFKKISCVQKLTWIIQDIQPIQANRIFALVSFWSIETIYA